MPLYAGVTTSPSLTVRHAIGPVKAPSLSLSMEESIKWEDLFRVAGENFSDGTSFGEELSAARVSGPEELRIG